jgi:hypothetical protein
MNKTEINSSPYIRAKHGLCKVEKNGKCYVSHTVAIAGWYLPGSHSVLPFRLMGHFDYAKALEYVLERGLDYTSFSQPTSGRMHFPSNSYLPETATAVVFEVARLIPLGHHDYNSRSLKIEDVNITLRAGHIKDGKWEIFTKELAAPAMPGFFGTNAAFYVDGLNEFCGSEIAKAVNEPNTVINHRIDNGITLKRKVKRKAQASSAIMSSNELAKAMCPTIQYPSEATKIAVAGTELSVQVWYNSVFKEAISKQLREAGINPNVLSRIPVYDIPMSLDRDGRLPKNLEYEITRLLGKYGHIYTFDEEAKAYYAVHNQHKQDMTRQQKLVAFGAYAQQQSKFLQRVSHGCQGSIWD